MRVSNASAEWKGSLKEGTGQFSTGSGAVQDVAFSFGTRFGETPGANPEELIAAAHAACFSMALSAQLGERGMTPESVRTTAKVTIDKTDDGLTVTSSHLDSIVRIPGGDQAKFEEAAQAAKTGCPISKLLNTEITLDARLVS